MRTRFSFPHHRVVTSGLMLGAAMLLTPASALAAPQGCDKSCLETMAAHYRAAYLAHDPRPLPLSPKLRFVENNVELRLPDGTWSTVTKEVGPALTLSDPRTGQVAVFTSIMQNDVPGFLAIRLKVQNRRITEVEHIISTRRNLSAPPTPIGDVESFTHDPDIARPVPVAERSSRADLIAQADGYFSTLENNDGNLRGGVRFLPDTTRFENGMKFPEVEKGFRLGRYHFNERVRDRDYFLVDEVRGVAMARAYIDHKGRLDHYALTDGTQTRSIFREPQSWGVMELFKIRKGVITAIEAVFVQTPYYMRSPFTAKPEMRAGGLTPPVTPPAPTSPAAANPILNEGGEEAAH